MRLRTEKWFARDDEVGLEHRVAMRAAGHPIPKNNGKPIIGVLNSVSELNPCNLPLRRLADAVKAGVEAAGGIPVETATMSLGEDLMKPTAMLYRNLMAMEIEETIRAYPLDGVVLLGNCDKTIPAQLMGAASANIPAVQVSGGYRRTGCFAGQPVGAGTDLWRYWNERRAGRLNDDQWVDLEHALGCSQGACNVMGTALTMAMMAESLDMMVEGGSTLPHDDDRLTRSAHAAGQLAVERVAHNVKPSDLLTPEKFAEALRILAALGGSTNAVIHLCAIAGRRLINLELKDFAAAARATPVIADVAPIGQHTIDEFDAAGGLPALRAALADPTSPRVGAIHSPAHPVTTLPALVALYGNLAPDGAVLKMAAASPHLGSYTGPAVVFYGYDDLLARIDDPGLQVSEASVLVLTGCGPAGGDGFPEWGMIPIPKKLAEIGVTDMLRISDARMSGTSFGTCVLHVAPEAAVGGPFAAIRDGDTISIDVARGTLQVDVAPEELKKRLADWTKPPSQHLRGWPALHEAHVLQAPQGADYDFLRPRTSAELDFVEPNVGRS